MKSSSVEQTETTKDLLLSELRESKVPMSLQELETHLGKNKNLSHRLLKEAAWKLVEEGKAQFNSTWDLEIT
ncbi:MAG: hypothetical protein Tsb0014_37350 [Pleurocapsa sp.]